MDIEQARTFLAIVETGSFVEAANRVFVTQSTVSARIRTLEDQLGKLLFTRSKSGAFLTSSGDQFLKHAQAMVRIWEHAKLEMALPEGYQSALTIGGQYSLWDGFLIEWLASMRSSSPDIAVRAQVGYSDVLMQWLIEGSLDLGVMYTPQARAGFEVELLFEDELILVAADPTPHDEPAKNYILIDWGPEFKADHALNYPEISVPGTYLELGSLSLPYLVRTKSSGYVPMRLAQSYFNDGALYQVKNKPTFFYPAYAVYPADSDPEFIELALQQLREIARTYQVG